MYQIAICTGSRAEWGLLEPIAYAIDTDPDLDLLLLVTGSHLSPAHGFTRNDIKLPVAECIECVMSSDTPVGVTTGRALAEMRFADTFQRYRPDCCVVLGDRWEVLGAALAAWDAQIPVVHLHGGDVTKGSLDNGYRNAISCLSSLHLTSNSGASYRLICNTFLNGATVRNVGALRDDMDAITAEHTVPEYDFVCLFHPALDAGITQLVTLLRALPRDQYGLFIHTNADAKGHIFNQTIDDFVSEVESWVVVDSLPRGTFLASVKRAGYMIGNSSAGITEAVGLGTPSINIGTRQKGRQVPGSVVNVENLTEAGIRAAIERVNGDAFRGVLPHVYNPYSGGKTSEEIVGIIKGWLRGCNSTE